MRRHDEMRQQRLAPARFARKSGKLGNDAVRTELGQQFHLCGARGLGALVRQVHDLALLGPSIALCGSSTKLFRSSECQW